MSLRSGAQGALTLSVGLLERGWVGGAGSRTLAAPTAGMGTKGRALRLPAVTRSKWGKARGHLAPEGRGPEPAARRM